MNNLQFIILLPTLLLWNSIGFCQINNVHEKPPAAELQNDTIPPLGADIDADSDSLELKTKKKRFTYRLLKEDYPNPKKALLMSLAIPGGGQFYNRKYWKIPIVWAGYAALIYSAQFNGSNYRDLREAVIAEFEMREHKFSDLGLDVNDLRRLRDQYDKRKQLSYIGLFALHLIQTAEAFVDCHLKTFDVSDDLSLKVGPSFQPNPNLDGITPGIGIAFILK